VKAVKEQDKLVQAVLDGGKSEIELIDEQIEAITKVALADGKYKDDQLAAIEQLQDEKKRIIDESVADEKEGHLKRAEARRTWQKTEVEEDEETFDEKLTLYNNYANQVSSIIGSIVEMVNAQADAEIASLESVAAKRIELLQAETEQETALNDFQNQLKEEALQRSIEETTQEIADLQAVGDEDSIQEANALQRDLDNAATERDLDTQAVEYSYTTFSSSNRSCRSCTSSYDSISTRTTETTTSNRGNYPR